MKSEPLLQELITRVAAYEATLAKGEAPVVKDFLAFARDAEEFTPDPYTIIRIARQVSLLHRYSKFYIKKTLKDSLLQTVDEYTYLASLVRVESLSKTELNNLNAMEKTSGNEVIRRLRKAGLVSEHRDETDRRSICVYITEKGREELGKLFPELRKAAVILSGKLGERQKKNLEELQKTLCAHHRDMFLNHKEEDLDELMQYLD